MHNLKWFEAEGDGGTKENGHAGQWGLRLARLLTDNIKIPVAIFNGACGGTPISYYERPNDYATNVKSNYGRLYYRLIKTGLRDKVRAVFWCQGETDGVNGTSTNVYEDLFDKLYSAWKQDFPKLEKTYIFQTKSETVLPLPNLMAVEEAQREEAAKYPNVEIIPTSALKADKSGFHFAYKGGYEKFGERLFYLVAHDLYNRSFKGKDGMNAPTIEKAYMKDSTLLTIEEKTKRLLLHNKKKPVEGFEIENKSGAYIDTIIIKKNRIFMYLSKFPGRGSTVSYIGRQNANQNWITSLDSIEPLSFNKYAISLPDGELRKGTKKYHHILPHVAPKQSVPQFVPKYKPVATRRLDDTLFINKADAKNEYVNGLKEGNWIEYLDNSYNLVNDTASPFYVLTVYNHGNPFAISRRYYKNGKLKDVFHFKNGVPNGARISYYESGKLKEMVPFVSGRIDGIARLYYENGKTKGETTYTQGIENGISKTYYPNGALQGSATFKDGKIIGVATLYYENGTVSSQISYVNGEVSSEVNYDSKGNKIN
jgi:antitoxin component YwqK of YwqJK toxin-antitoxin module